MGTSCILIPKQYLESRRHKSPSKMAQFQGFGAEPHRITWSPLAMWSMQISSLRCWPWAETGPVGEWTQWTLRELLIYYQQINYMEKRLTKANMWIELIHCNHCIKIYLAKPDIFLIRAFGVPTWTLGSSLPGGTFQRLRFSVLQIPGRSSTCSWEPMNGNGGEDMMKT